MRIILIFFCICFLQNCSKPKTVLICGDHVCVNKNEAEQYFEENLSIEVQILDKKKSKNIDLVELNLKTDSNNVRQVSIKKKNITYKKLKVLTNKERNKIKIDLKKKKVQNNIVNKLALKEKTSKKALLNKEKKLIKKKLVKKDVSKKTLLKKVKKNSITTNNDKITKENEIIDICKIIEKCNIDEISDFLIGQGKEKNFPDITIRE